jgi:hypothetical protein
VRQAILENGDPPDQVMYQGVTYFFEEMAGGAFLKNGQGPGRNLLRWDYEDEEGENYLTIEQWGEDDFLAYAGRPVQEYQFTNILPPA